jgi:hypothetical protein
MAKSIKTIPGNDRIPGDWLTGTARNEWFLRWFAVLTSSVKREDGLEQIEMLSCRNKVHLELIMVSETLCLFDPSEYQNKSTLTLRKDFGATLKQ